jgi:hypothetical protein
MTVRPAHPTAPPAKHEQHRNDEKRVENNFSFGMKLYSIVSLIIPQIV